MKIFSGAAVALLFLASSAQAADDVLITRLLTCQDSWLDWKDNPAKSKPFVDHVRALFTPHGNDPYMLPKQNVTVAGLHVSQLFPESVGMGLGFSATVDVPFEKGRAALEKMSGKKLGHCEDSDGMNACELQIAEKRNLMAMAVDGQKPEQTLIGCYYYYEK
jgi:hypothetical protein